MKPTELKRLAGEYAANHYIESGMTIGLGTGTTAIWMLRRLAERLEGNDLSDIQGIPTSQQTAAEAKRLGVPLTTLNEHPQVHITIDGADEIDPQLNLIKGGGGALLREKIVAEASEQVIIVADASKQVKQLGTTFKLPVEVVPFAGGAVRQFLDGLGCRVSQRVDDNGKPFVTDEHNHIYDCVFEEGIIAPQLLAEKLSGKAGIVEHGLFINLAKTAIVATDSGIVILTA